MLLASFLKRLIIVGRVYFQFLYCEKLDNSTPDHFKSRWLVFIGRFKDKTTSEKRQFVWFSTKKAKNPSAGICVQLTSIEADGLYLITRHVFNPLVYQNGTSVRPVKSNRANTYGCAEHFHLNSTRRSFFGGD